MSDYFPVILHVVNSFLVRTETFIFNYLTSFKTIEPVVLAENRKNRDEFKFRNVYTVPRPGKTGSLSWLKAVLFQTVFGIQLRQHRINELIKKTHPALIHAHFGPNGWKMLPIKQRFCLPLITSFYGFDMSQLLTAGEWRQKYQELFREGDFFLVEGPFMKQKLIELGAPEEKVHIQPIAIKVSDYPAWKPARNVPTVLFAARFIEKKGLMEALQAIAELKNEISEIQLRIIGYGPEQAKAEKFVHQYHLEKNVVFLGSKTHGELVKEMAQAHVFIQPSHTASDGDSEGGAPTTLLEAQAIGIPIVTTRHADIPHVVGNDPNIYVCQEKNASELVRSLKSALSSSKPISSAFVKTNHDLDAQVAKLEALYKAAIQNSQTIQTLK